MPEKSGYYWARYKTPNQDWEIVRFYSSPTINYRIVQCVNDDNDYNPDKFIFASDTPLEGPADANG